jgi:hypothetical protein
MPIFDRSLQRTKIATMLKVAKVAPLPDWGRRFEPSIPVQNGRSLFALRDAGKFIEALPKAEQQAPRWRTAIEMLLFAAEKSAPTMMARIGMMKALHDREPQADFPARRRARKYTLIR